MEKTPQNRYSITAKGAAFLAAVDAGLVDGTETGVDKFEKFWRLWEQSAQNVLKERGDEKREKISNNQKCVISALISLLIAFVVPFLLNRFVF